MMRYKYSLLVFQVLLFTACFESADKKLLLGKWQGVEWLSDGKPAGMAANQASFHFRDDGTYTYAYGYKQEQGKYRVSYMELYTIPEGGIEMMVRIKTLTADSLVFDMNRGGHAETLSLVRK